MSKTKEDREIEQIAQWKERWDTGTPIFDDAVFHEKISHSLYQRAINRLVVQRTETLLEKWKKKRVSKK